MSFLDSPRARSILPLIAALSAHAVLILGASRLPSPRSLLTSLAPADHTDAVDVDVENIEPPPTPAPPEPHPEPSREEEKRRAPETAAVHVEGHAAVSRPAQATREPSVSPPAPATGGTKGTEGPPPSDEYGGAPPPPAFDPLSSVTRGFALQAAAAAPTEAPRAATVDGDVANHAIQSTLRSHDKKAGVNVPAAGVVASVVSTTVRSMALPHNAHATIEVTLGPHGTVMGARVASTSAGGAAEWDSAMKSVTNSLSSAPLKLGPDVEKTGVVVKVSVTTKHVFPSGTAKAADVKPRCANGFINDLATAADDKPSKPVDPKVPLFQDENGRPCIPVGVSIAGDAANIGAEKHIEVQSSFEVIVPGQMDLPEEIDPVNTDAPWVERGKPGPRPTLPQKARQYLRERERRK